MRFRLGLLAVLAVIAITFAVQGASSKAKPGLMQRIASGKLHRAVIHVNGVTKQLPFFSGGIVTSAQEASGTFAVARSRAGVPGAAVKSLGCSERNLGRNVRVNQDCTYRRQAENHIAFNPVDPNNLVAGVNDSIIGWNQTSIDFSLDGGKHWGAISTAPFRFRLNAPEDLLPTAGDPNRHTITGSSGTLHSYDACSDPYIAFDSRGGAFYTCVTFDIASNANMVFVVSSPPDAKGSYFDQVPAPFGLTSPATGREHIVMEDNSLAAAADGPKLAADSYRTSPNRDNVYSTFTVFNFTCGATHDQYCSSKIYGSMSTDHGFTWSTPEPISGAKPGVCILGNTFDPKANPNECNFNGHSDVAVLPSGDLAVTFENGNTPGLDQQLLALHCHPTGSSPAGSARLHCNRPTKAADMLVAKAPRCNFGGGPEQCIPGAFIRAPVETAQRITVNQATGDLLLTWYDYRFGEFDIFASQSTDGGRTWGAARLVNPDRGMDHYFSAIDVGERGARTAISYYRTHRIPNESTTPADGFGLTDPGVARRMSDYVLSWGMKLHTPFVFDVLSPKFPAPDGVQEGFNGDYTGITVTPDNQAHPVWSDTRSRVRNPGFNHLTVDEDMFTASHGIG
jgi:hypothetical protein